MFENRLVRVEIPDPDGNVESLPATPLGDDLFRLEHSPFFAYGVSWLDVVEARALVPGGPLQFVRIATRSGNRTVRVILSPPPDQSPQNAKVIASLTSIGCTYEASNPGFISVNVPREVDLMLVTKYLSGTGQQWEHADPTYAKLHPNDKASAPN